MIYRGEVRNDERAQLRDLLYTMLLWRRLLFYHTYCMPSPLKKKHFQVSFLLFQNLLNYLVKNKNYVCS